MFRSKTGLTAWRDKASESRSIQIAVYAPGSSGKQTIDSPAVLHLHTHTFGRLLFFALRLQASTPDQERMWTVRLVDEAHWMLESYPAIIAKAMAEKKGLRGAIFLFSSEFRNLQRISRDVH